MPRLSSHVLRHALEENSPRGEQSAGARSSGRTVIAKETLKRKAVLELLVLAGVLAYTTFQWGGVVRTGRYQYLLVLGLLAMLLSLGRSWEEWSPLPGRVMRWVAVLLPAYVLLQVVPL